LQCRIHVCQKKKLQNSSHLALNDLVLYRGSFPHTITLSVSLDDHRLIDAQGDGVIISTAAGSTGSVWTVLGCVFLKKK
jgi:NAD kinase